MKAYPFILLLRKFLELGEDTQISLIAWLIIAAIETLVISVIVAAIAKACGEEFDEWFGGSIVVVGVIEIIIALVSSF